MSKNPELSSALDLTQSKTELPPPTVLGNPGIVNDPLGRYRVPPILGVNFAPRREIKSIDPVDRSQSKQPPLFEPENKPSSKL